MLTIEGLQALGVDTTDGLKRCMQQEEFYYRLIRMALADTKYGELREAISAGDLEKGFEYAHALKGMLANLSLTPLLEPVLEMTELLRARESCDYSGLLSRMDEEREKLLALDGAQ